MASMAVEVAGALSAILQSSERLFELDEKCSRTIRRMRNPDYEIEDFGLMFSDLANSLFHLHAAGKDMERWQFRAKRPSQIQELVIAASRITQSKLQQIEDALQKLRPLRGDNESRTSLIKAKFMWALCDRQDLRDLLASIETIESSVAQLTVLSHVTACVKEIEKMQLDLEDIPVDLVSRLAILDRRNRHLQRECRDVNRCYEDQFTTEKPKSAQTPYRGSRTLDFILRTERLAEKEITATRNLLRDLKRGSSSTLSSGTTARSQEQRSSNSTSQYSDSSVGNYHIQNGRSSIAMPSGREFSNHSQRNSVHVRGAIVPTSSPALPQTDSRTNIPDFSRGSSSEDSSSDDESSSDSTASFDFEAQISPRHHQEDRTHTEIESRGLDIADTRSLYPGLPASSYAVPHPVSVTPPDQPRRQSYQGDDDVSSLSSCTASVRSRPVSVSSWEEW